MVSDKEIEAAIKAIEAVPIMGDTYSLSGEDSKAVARAALEAARAVKGWEAVMPNKQITDEMVEAGAKALGGDDWITCVHDRPMWRREAKEVLEAALSAAAPAPINLADAEKAFLDRVWPKLQSGCYRAHGSIPVEIKGLNFNEFVRDGLCAVLEAADPQPSGKIEEAAQIIQAFIDQGLDYIKRNNRVEEALHHLKIIEGEANRVTNPVTKNNLLYEIERIRSALTAGKPDGEAVPSGPVEALKRIAQLKEVRRGGGVFDYEPALSAMEMYEIALDALSALTADKPHPDDEAVDRFAAAMKAKLKWEREERGRYGWNDPEVCSEEYLAQLLIEHLAKGNDGNFEDVANLCMMLHQRGAHPHVLADALTADEPMLDLLREARWFVEVYDNRESNSEVDSLLSRIDAILRAAPTAGKPEQSGWQPIETAPKDGTQFQAWIEKYGWEPHARFNPDSEAFELWGRVDYDKDGWDVYPHMVPTHWMPLPTPPTAGGSDE